MWRYAGILGIAPDPFTLAELHRMFGARAEYDWDYRSQVLAALINPHRDRSKHPRPISADALNPFSRKRLSRALPPVPISELKGLFMGTI